MLVRPKSGTKVVYEDSTSVVLQWCYSGATVVLGWMTRVED